MNFKLYLEASNSDWIDGASVRVVIPVKDEKIAMQMVQSMPQEHQSAARVGQTSDAYHSGLSPAVFLYVPDQHSGTQIIQGLPPEMRQDAKIENRPAAR